MKTVQKVVREAYNVSFRAPSWSFRDETTLAYSKEEALRNVVFRSCGKDSRLVLATLRDKPAQYKVNKIQ